MGFLSVEINDLFSIKIFEKDLIENGIEQYYIDVINTFSDQIDVNKTNKSLNY
jgi:hypothetical protein